MDSPWKLFGRSPVIGEISPHYASVRRRVGWRCLFHLCLDVSLLPDHGTMLICRRGLHPLLCLLASGWFGLLVAILGLGGVFAIAGGFLVFSWPALLVPPTLLIALGLAFVMGRGDAAKDHAFLIERLALMTEATPI